MVVVVMDYVQDDRTQRDELPEKWVEGLKKGLDVLHQSNLVFGDLRWPNLLLHGGDIKFIGVGRMVLHAIPRTSVMIMAGTLT